MDCHKVKQVILIVAIMGYLDNIELEILEKAQKMERSSCKQRE